MEWNPEGGEDGYGVDEVGTVYAQGEAARAFGVSAYFKNAAGVNTGQSSAGKAYGLTK